MRLGVTTAVLAAGVLALSACSSSSSGSNSAGGVSGTAGGSGGHGAFSACLIISATGIADHSFNQQAWGALTQAKSKLGINIKYLAQSGSTDYSTLGAQFVQQG
ncbi:MAG: hypothetical protein QOE95_2271, partial [Gaiellaceae bacterium]|nr:hypothetical protein [Gaiellaceae bacterium]